MGNAKQSAKKSTKPSKRAWNEAESVIFLLPISHTAHTLKNLRNPCRTRYSQETQKKKNKENEEGKDWEKVPEKEEVVLWKKRKRNIKNGKQTQTKKAKILSFFALKIWRIKETKDSKLDSKSWINISNNRWKQRVLENENEVPQMRKTLIQREVFGVRNREREMDKLKQKSKLSVGGCRKCLVQEKERMSFMWFFVE